MYLDQLQRVVLNSNVNQKYRREQLQVLASDLELCIGRSLADEMGEIRSSIQFSAIDGLDKRTVYFHARRENHEFEVHGNREIFLGHRIPCSCCEAGDGIFAEWKWHEGRLTATCDRYGMYPLFYIALGNEIWLSTSIPLLLEKTGRSELDYPALSVFLRTGYFVGEDTAFASIRALKPDCQLSWNGQLQITGTLRISKPETIPDKDAVQRFIELFRSAIRKRIVTEEVTLPLSGGRDSRHILLELCSQGHPPELAVTMDYPPPRISEALIAKQLCDAVGVQHERLDAEHDSLDWELRKNLATNFLALEHSWALNLAEKLEGRQSVIYDGIAGDVLSSSANLSPERVRLCSEGKVKAVAEDILGPEYLGKLLARRFRNALGREVALERITKELKQHFGAPNPIGSFFFWNRARRTVATAPFNLLERVGTVMAPFVDHQLWDFLSSLPAEMLVDRTFHTRTLQQAYPGVASIPFDNKPTVAVPISISRRRAARLLGYALRNSPQLFDTAAVLPRLGRALLQPRYFETMGLSNPVVYVGQLSELQQRGLVLPR